MKKRILLLEDEKHLADMLKLNLDLEGYNAVVVGDGQAAIAKFKEEKFDLAILDIMVPNIDGIGVAESIRLSDTQMPILFLSAKGNAEDRILGLKKGGDDYLAKPFNLEELLLRVKKLLSRTNPMWLRAILTNTVLVLIILISIAMKLQVLPVHFH
jgi:two-component system alkaline phosphatase synthesis response regulator PhoP